MLDVLQVDTVTTLDMLQVDSVDTRHATVDDYRMLENIPLSHTLRCQPPAHQELSPSKQVCSRRRQNRRKQPTDWRDDEEDAGRVTARFERLKKARVLLRLLSVPRERDNPADRQLRT
ncbi:hypothetical protein BaRGS_00038320 [Batillaria attramentaria]|uniref:Uncharacterized protein n=1 Tax=Batillaria attramentaria TaxID=370345 RepID=A0ABD0J6F6_9CAEN